MANFLKMENIYEMYDLTMSVFESCAKRYDITLLKVYYEDIVSNYRATLTSLLNFLELEWDENMADHTIQAKKRKVINTPSYDQVILPIYNNAKFRWLNYQDHLAGHEVLLSRWIDKFGY